MKLVNSPRTLTAMAGSDDSLNRGGVRHSPAVLILIGTTACEVGGILHQTAGDDPAIAILATDTAASTRDALCSNSGLPESKFIEQQLPSAMQSVEIASRYPGTTTLVPGLRECKGEAAEPGSGRQQVAACMGGVIARPTLTPRIQSLINSAHAADNSAGGSQTFIALVASANGSTGSGQILIAAKAARDAARLSQTAAPKVVLFMLVEYSPEATSHPGSLPSLYGAIGAAAGSSTGDPAVGIPTLEELVVGEQGVDEVVVVTANRGGKMLSRQELLTECADTILSRIDRRERIVGGDFRNYRTMPEHNADPDLGNRMISTRSVASIAFTRLEPIGIIRGAAVLKDRLLNPSKNPDAKKIRREKDITVAGLLAAAAGAGDAARRLNPATAEQGLKTLTARRSAEAGAAKADTARRAVEETHADMIRLRAAAETEAERRLGDFADAFADDLRKRQLPPAIAAWGLADVAKVLDDAARQMPDTERSKSNADDIANRVRQTGESLKRAKLAFEKSDGPIARATGAYQKKAAHLIEAMAQAEFAEWRAIVQRSLHVLPDRLAAACREIGASLSDAQTEIVERFDEAVRSAEIGATTAPGSVERLPDDESVGRLIEGIFNPVTVEVAASAMARKIALGQPINLPAEANRIIRADGVALPSNLTELLAAVSQNDLRRQVDRLLQRVSVVNTALFDATGAPGRTPANVLVISRPEAAAAILDPIFARINTHPITRIVDSSDENVVQFAVDSRMWAPGELKFWKPAREAFEALSPARQIVHGPYIIPGRSLPRWGIPDSRERSAAARTTLFDLLARDIAQRNSGDAIRLNRATAARVGCPNAGLIGRGFDNAADALAASPRLLSALGAEIVKHDRALGGDDLLDRLQAAMNAADALVPRAVFDNFARYIQTKIDALVARGAGRNDDFGPPAL